MIKKYVFLLLSCLWLDYSSVMRASQDPFVNVFVDTFGDLVVGERVDDINVQFQYGIPNDQPNYLSTYVLYKKTVILIGLLAVQAIF